MYLSEQGLCHYVGSYPETFIDLWKSRDQHVFCCFGSKLARVLQENARSQLALAWGNPKYADCRGVTLEEISRLDFSKMDFSELYEDFAGNLPADYQERLGSFADRMSEKIGEGK